MFERLTRAINEKTVQHRFYIIAFFGSLITLTLLAPWIVMRVPQGLARDAGEQDMARMVDPSLGDLSLVAHAAYVVDLSSHAVLFTKNAETSLPLASLTKLMTALVVYDADAVDQEAIIQASDLTPQGDSGFIPGESWVVKDLAHAMLVMSSNDAASALARVVGGGSRDAFIVMMNNRALSLGLKTMVFRNESGLDEGNDTGGMGSAHDVALLLERLWKTYPNALGATRSESITLHAKNSKPRVFVNTNEALHAFPGMVASKTGYTDMAGGNLAIIFDISIGHPVLAVVLGSTHEGRFADMETIVRAVGEHAAE